MSIASWDRPSYTITHYHVVDQNGYVYDTFSNEEDAQERADIYNADCISEGSSDRHEVIIEHEEVDGQEPNWNEIDNYKDL